MTDVYIEVYNRMCHYEYEYNIYSLAYLKSVTQCSN